MGRPALILVTGPPGSGKTTLAYALGAALDRLDDLDGLADLRVVRCRLAADQARERMARRAGQATRAAHADAEHRAGAPPFTALDLDVPTLDVDTTEGYRPDLASIVAFSRP